MNFEIYQYVALCRDLPEYNLKKGDVATLIDRVPHPTGGEDGGILEIFNAVGESIAVVAVPLSNVQPLTADEIFAVRSLIQTG